MDTSNGKLLYKVETAAALCDMGRSKFWELVLSGQIESIKIGRARRIPANGLHAWIDRQIAQGSHTARLRAEQAVSAGDVCI